MTLRTVHASRYVTPLREGGSLPAIIEADDDGLYVLKFRGAGQGLKALIAEVIAAEIARTLGFDVPEIVLVELDPEIARTEPDPEIQDLVRASGGLNLGMDYLPGSITFDPAVETIDAELASELVWFDAFTSNIDRTARNTNLLMWHGRLRPIDHGAALFFHHTWKDWEARAKSPFTQICEHVLLPAASDIAAADSRLAPLLTREELTRIVSLVPDEWLTIDAPFDKPEAHRAAYVDYLTLRLEEPRAFVKEVADAHAASL